MSFGEFFRDRRIKQGMTLRGFCERFGQDPAYISRLENSKIAPSIVDEKLITLAMTLSIKKDTPDWVTFYDLAYKANQQIPKEITSAAPELVSLLPAFLRTKENKKISKEKVKELVDFLAKGGLE